MKNKSVYGLQQKTNIQTAKVLLDSLASFGKYLSSLDKHILDKAQYSYMDYNYTYNQVESICNLIDSSRTLKNLNRRITETLAEAPAVYEKVIYLRYHHRLSAHEAAKIMGVSKRTVFRKTKDAVEWFTHRLDKIIDPAAYLELLTNELLFRNLHNRV